MGEAKRHQASGGSGVAAQASALASVPVTPEPAPSTPGVVAEPVKAKKKPRKRHKTNTETQRERRRRRRRRYRARRRLERLERNRELAAELGSTAEAQRASLPALVEAVPPVLAGPDVVPLAIGTSALLVARLGCEDRLGVWLELWCSRREYRAALAAEGAMRRDADGHPVEPVSPKHAAQARALLASPGPTHEVRRAQTGLLTG